MGEGMALKGSGAEQPEAALAAATQHAPVLRVVLAPLTQQVKPH
jgi:hypothetical protein